MAGRKVFRCIVDDTALITNINEIESWVFKGAITLVVPLYTLERLHILKKDASQLGVNARKAVKFLDRVTSGKHDLSIEPVILQGPEEQYATWAEVEEHYTDDTTVEDQNEEKQAGVKTNAKENSSQKGTQSAGGALSQMLLDKLNFAKVPELSSPNSTPPSSPVSSEPQSSKTSPEVKSAIMTVHDASPTPPALKPLINSVVWYIFEKASTTNAGILFLTNAADTANLMRTFGVTPKNIHQLRTAVGMEEIEAKNQGKFQRKHVTPPSTAVPEVEPKPMFKYEDDESEDEVVVFKPRGRGARGATTARGSPTSHNRHRHSLQKLSPNASSPAPQSMPSKPQIPTEEIDPDSFDRGSFARGSVPLVNTSNYLTNSPFHGFHRGPSSRGSYTSGGSSRGAFPRGGSSRGFDRGSVRGRGKLFVP